MMEMLPPRTPTQAAPRRAARRTDVARWPLRWAGASLSREGELFRAVVRQLVRHVGGRPSAAQELLIGRLAMLAVHLAHLDERALKDGGIGSHATREYLAWHGQFTRGLRMLGMQGVAAPVPTLAEIMAAPAPNVPTTAPAAADDEDDADAPDATSAAPAPPAEAVSA